MTGMGAATTQNVENPSRQLAEFAAGLRLRDLPAPVVEAAKWRLLDLLGVALYGSRFEWSRCVAEFVGRQAGSGDCTVLGTDRRAPAPLAALANGTAAHGFELDDVHDPSVSHPGAVVIPAALAVAENPALCGGELLVAIVAGYELAARMGAAAGEGLVERGFHPTSAGCAFGSAAAAGSCLGLDADRMQNALGVAASFASGLMEFSQDPKGTMIKRLHAGWASQAGVVAAQLAANGFTGPSRFADGRYGFLNVFSDRPDPSRLTAGLGSAFEILCISVKPYACCRLFHSAIDAIRELKREAQLEPDAVTTIEVAGPRLMVDQHMIYDPQSVMALQYSMPLCLAIALAADPLDPSAYLAALGDEAMAGIAAKITASVDPRLDALFPASFPTRVILNLADGRRLEREVLDSLGTPGRPLDGPDLLAKFRAVTGDVLSAAEQDRLIETVMALERVENVRMLGQLLAQGRRSQ